MTSCIAAIVVYYGTRGIVMLMVFALAVRLARWRGF